jgi:hypothetical protein
MQDAPVELEDQFGGAGADRQHGDATSDEAARGTGPPDGLARGSGPARPAGV